MTHHRAFVSGLVAAWKWLAVHKDSLTITFAIIAGCTALYQYRQSVDDGKRKETLKYVERGQDARVGHARAAITSVLLDETKVKAYRAAANLASSAAQDATSLDKFVVDNKLEVDLIVLTEHFINLAACVKADVCDKLLACEYFKPEIVAVNNTFRQLFDSVWKKRAGVNYMDGPMAFARDCGAPR